MRSAKALLKLRVFAGNLLLANTVYVGLISLSLSLCRFRRYVGVVVGAFYKKKSCPVKAKFHKER